MARRREATNIEIILKRVLKTGAVGLLGSLTITGCASPSHSAKVAQGPRTTYIKPEAVSSPWRCLTAQILTEHAVSPTTLPVEIKRAERNILVVRGSKRYTPKLLETVALPLAPDEHGQLADQYGLVNSRPDLTQLPANEHGNMYAAVVALQPHKVSDGKSLHTDYGGLAIITEQAVAGHGVADIGPVSLEPAHDISHSHELQLGQFTVAGAGGCVS